MLFEFAHVGGRCGLRPLVPQERAGGQALCRRDLVDTLAETAVQMARRPTLLSRIWHPKPTAVELGFGAAREGEDENQMAASGAGVSRFGTRTAP